MTTVMKQSTQLIISKMGYVTPEGCLKRAGELYNEGNWQEAVAILHVGLQNRKTKQNMIILEKLMTSMIDICSENLSNLHLKEDIGYFRNLCQHQSMPLLEKILKLLRNKAEKVYEKLEQEFGHDELKKYISDEQEDADGPTINEQDCSPEDMIFLAYTSLDHIEKKQAIQPRANFFLDTCKNILDTLRSNSKLLDFYNDTAKKIFDFCSKYRCKREYRRISDTLHSHFKQIIQNDKTPDQSNKIPYPIKLDDQDQVAKVLKMRKDQLDLALLMQEWTDAHKISKNIFQLMIKVKSKRTETEINKIFSVFFGHLSSIFWESELYLFHTYALQNVQHLVRGFKTSTD